MDIVYNSKFANGETIQPGNYKLEIPLNTQNPELKFFQNGKLMASVPAQVKGEARKAVSTEIDYSQLGGAHVITEVRPAGLSEALIFSKSSQTKSGS